MACVQCGSPLRPELLYCTQCGARQPAGAARQQPVAGSDFKRFLFVRSVLEKLGDGAFFRRFFSTVLYVLAGCQAAGGIIGGIYLVDVVFRQTVGGFVAYLVFLPLLLVGVYMLAHATLIRARTIAGLPAGTAYGMVPIFALILKYLGEQAGIGCLLAGVLNCLTAWFGNGAANAAAWPFSYGGAGFLRGLYLLGLFLLAALGCLVLTYFLAEIIIAMVDVAVNTREIAANTRSRAQIRAAAGE